MTTKIERIFTAINYPILMLTILGQCTVGSSFYIGQGLWLLANGLSVTRCWVLHRPIADKVRDTALLAITAGLITIKYLGGIVS